MVRAANPGRKKQNDAALYFYELSGRCAQHAGRPRAVACEPNRHAEFRLGACIVNKTPEAFCHWMAGFMEFSDSLPTVEQWALMRQRLKEVISQPSPASPLSPFPYYPPNVRGGIQPCDYLPDWTPQSNITVKSPTAAQSPPIFVPYFVESPHSGNWTPSVSAGESIWDR